MKRSLPFHRKVVILFCSTLFITLRVLGQATNPTPQPIPYFQDFSTLPPSSTTYPAGWQGWLLGNASIPSFATTVPTANLNFAVGTAASTAGNVTYNYNQKVGFLASGTSNPSMVMAISTTNFQNIQMSFSIMTIRNPFVNPTNTRINQVDIQYRIGTSGNFTSLSGNPNGIYRNILVNQVTGTTPQNQQSVILTLPPALYDQSVVQLRWVQRDSSGVGSRPSFAIDNIVINGSPVPPTIYVSTPTLPDFGSVQTGDSSAFQSYTVAGRHLVDDIYINSPPGFLVSLSPNSGYTPSLVLPRNVDSVTTTTIYIKFVPAFTGPSGGNVFHNSSGASPSTVSVTGTGYFCVDPALSVTASSTNASCSSCIDGSVSANATDGQPPYNYQWSTGHMTPFVSGLPPGTYTVTVTDAYYCTVSATTTIGSSTPVIPVTIFSLQRINLLSPFVIQQSPYIAVNYSYYNPVNPKGYLNIMAYDYMSLTEFWMAQNLTLDSFPSTRNLVYEANLANYINLQPGSPLGALGIKIFVTDTVFFSPVSSPPSAYQPFPIGNIDYKLSTTVFITDTTPRIPPITPVPPNTYVRTDTSKSVLRGCTVPNVDLDSAGHNNGNTPGYAGDYNACGPASAANSMEWLEARHPEIVTNKTLREKLQALSAAMSRLVNAGVSTENFIKGKLGFIDDNKLPIHVKFQSNLINNASVASPNPNYGHNAQNQGKNLGAGGNHVDPEWAFNEMKNGEDVEGWLTFQKLVPRPGKPDSVVNLGAHLVVLTGVAVVNGVASVDYKDDIDQSAAGGTRERTGIKVNTTPNGYPYIDAWTDVAGATHVTWIDGYFSESFDASITFPPLVSAGPDQSVGAGGTASLSGSFSGSTSSITWTSSGTGTFSPSAFVTNAIYIPSAADINNGGVTITIASDSVPGYVRATDQMNLIITPYPFFFAAQTLRRIHYHAPLESTFSPELVLSYSYINLYAPPKYLNIMGYKPDQSGQVWLGQNILLDSFPGGTRNLEYEFNLANYVSLITSDTTSQLRIKFFVTDTVLFDPIFSPINAYQLYPIVIDNYFLGIDIFNDTVYRIPPIIPIPPNTYVRTDTSKSVTRGCTVPNVDLDSAGHNNGNTPGYAGDDNACGPASAANSMAWLELRHPEINSNKDLRTKLQALSAAMSRLINSGVSTKDFIKGKLAFIDDNKLPIHVKYQSNNNTDSSIASPNPNYGHKAENKGKNIGAGGNHVEYDWMFNEMKDGEDVEAWLTFQKLVPRPGQPDSVVNLGAHLVVLTGVAVVNGVPSLDYKDDKDQSTTGGTRERTGIKVNTTADGYPYIDAWVDAAGATHVTWVDGYFAESYDPTITFPPTVSAGPDQSIPAGGNAHLNGSFGGSTTAVTWTTSGTGLFFPSPFVTDPIYIPSAADIQIELVALSLTSNAPPGYSPAVDSMLLTITPYPFNTTVNNVNRINYHYPQQINLSSQIAVHFNYYNPDSTGWYMNLMGYDYRTNQEFWLARNLALHPFPSSRDLVFETSLQPFINLYPGDTMSNIGIKIFIADSIWFVPILSPAPAYQPYVLLPDNYFISFGINLPLIDSLLQIPPPIPPNPFVSTDSTRSVIRGCTVPNEPLDSSKYNHATDSTYAGDWNACGPVSAANSMSWLELRHPSTINTGLTTREKLKELSGMMNRPVDGTATVKQFIEGKLAFIDKHKLPIHVKFQTLDKHVNAGTVASPNPDYGHSAQNQGKNLGQQNKNHVDFDWIFDEMKNGEDVELALITYKQTPKPGGGYNPAVVDGGHAVVLTGIEENKSIRKIDYKDDASQGDSTGEQERTGIEVDTFNNGKPYIDQWVDDDGTKYFTVIEGAISESYDSTITFPPKVSAGPDQSVPAGQSAHMQGSFGGSATGATWSTSGTGTFVPSFFDVFADYIPSPSDISAGSVTLTLTTDTPPGYQAATDQMLLTITPITVTLNVKVLLEGFYMGGGSMQTLLYNLGLNTDTSATDMITIALYVDTNLSSPAYSQTTLLHNDGNTYITLPYAVLGHSYYIAVRQRHAIETWSKQPVLFNGSIVHFDFTTY